MARGKKKETLTPEERLQAALVPKSEQPYKVPGNWCWTRLGFLLQSSKEKTDEFSDADLKYVGLEHMQKDGGIVAYDSAERVKSLKNVFHPQQILYGKLRPYLNKHDIATFDGVCSTDILVFNVVLATIPKFINFFLDQDTFIEYAISNSKGINLPRVSESVVLNAKCPLPPFAEQQRIVERIESLFAKLDEAKQKAQDALDSFDTRKAAILHKAFTGELTAQWRKEHGVGMESWETHELVECFEIVSGIQKTPARSPRHNPIPYLAVANVYRNKIDLSDIRYFEVTPEEIEKLKLQDKDILIVEGNGSGKEIGRCAMWHNELPLCVHQNHIIRIRNKSPKILPEYVLYYLNSETGKSVMQERAKTTAGLFNLSAGKVKTIPLPFASLDEQAEIVHILDDLIAKEQQAKEAAEKVLEQIDLIKKSILARAFRGELGTNDPSEESAVELLKQVL